MPWPQRIGFELVAQLLHVPGIAPGGMAFWRERLFAAMARNAGSVTDFFNIPANRAVELGTRVEI